MNNKKWDNYKKFAEANLEKIKYVLIGQDPYPTDANGIPFCKDDLMKLKNTSVQYILQKFGIDVSTEILDGETIFKRLLTINGVLFLNLSYEELKTSKKSRKINFEEGLAINKVFLEIPNAEYIKLGLGKKMLNYFRINYLNRITSNKVFAVIHPSPRNKSTRHEEWKSCWDSLHIEDLKKNGVRLNSIA